MTDISLEMVREIRDYINNPFIMYGLILKEREKWLEVTAALDTIEDSACAIAFYPKADVDNSELGNLYLHIYGLLQALYVSQECLVSIRKSLTNKGIDFKKESPDLYYVRNVRDDILHATNRQKDTKKAIYLVQWCLSKFQFEYIEQSAKEKESTREVVNVIELIDKNNKAVNKFLLEIKNEMKSKIESKKAEYRKTKIWNIFSGLNYAAEKMREDSYMSPAGYESTKNMLQNYKKALDERYCSWEMVDGDAYEIRAVEKVYDILEDREVQKSHMSSETIKAIEEILIDSLIWHLRNLEEFAHAHDLECEEQSMDEAEEAKEITVNISFAPEKDVE